MISKQIEVETSGYVRGYVTIIAYYDEDTKELIDWERNDWSIDIIRDDTEVDTYDIPSKLGN